MSDATLFYILLWVLYTIECLQRAPKASIVLVQNRRDAFSIRKQVNVISNSLNGSFFFAGLLSPDRHFFLSAGDPISYSAMGLRVSSAAEDRILIWPQVESVETAGTEIIINGDIRAEYVSATSARKTAGTILKIIRSSDENRAALIQALVRDSLDVQRLCFAMDRLYRHLGILPGYSFVLFLLMFGAAPMIGWFYNLGVAIIIVVPLAWILSTHISLLTRRLHDSLIGKGARLQRSRVIYSALYPPAAIVSWHTITRDYLSDVHPLALSFHLSDRTDFRRFASEWLRDFLHSAPPADTDSGKREFARSHFEIIKKEVESFFSQRGMNINEFIRPPDDFAREGTKYCPRCLALFAEESSVCSDCEIELVKHRVVQ